LPTFFRFLLLIPFTGGIVFGDLIGHRMTKRIALILTGVSVIFVMSYFGISKARQFIAIDDCLDKGGQWNYQHNECESIGVIDALNRKLTHGFEMVSIKGGAFIMGGADNANDGGPLGKSATDECPHTVNVKDFFIGKYEVTQKEWQEIMGSNPSYYKGCSSCPVEQVSWEDVLAFINIVNAKYGENFRLPTEEEWEFAARGGVNSKDFRYSGSNNANDVAWWKDNSGGKPHSVGRLKPNELGIYDMSGNIWEWCSNFKVPYPCDVNGKKFDAKVLRGGTFANDTSSVRVRDRNGRDANMRLSTLGFRLAK